MEPVGKRKMIVGLACLIVSVVIGVVIPCILKYLIFSGIQDEAPIENVSCLLKFSLLAVVVGGIFAVSGIVLLLASIKNRNRRTGVEPS